MAGKRGHNLRGPNSQDRARLTGEAHPGWKGDEALPATKRQRAVRRFVLDECERCGKKATDRHHKDGNTGNNEESNIAKLCRRCHMLVDGRLEVITAMLKACNKAKSQRVVPPCKICGRHLGPQRHGRCPACPIYLRRTGVEWSPSVYTKKPRNATRAGETYTENHKKIKRQARKDRRDG